LVGRRHSPVKGEIRTTPPAEGVASRKELLFTGGVGRGLGGELVRGGGV